MDASNDVTTEVAKSEVADVLAELIDGEGLTLGAGLHVTTIDVQRGHKINMALSNGQQFLITVEYDGE
jgi:hypothetical protein